MARELKCGKMGITVYLPADVLAKVRVRADRTGAKVNTVLARAVVRGLGHAR